MIAIFHGVQLGLVLTLLIGPVFFTILQTSLERGFKKGVLVAVGVSISDILYVVICYLGLAQLMANSDLKVYMAYGGGMILVGFGIYHLIIKTRTTTAQASSPVTEKRLYRYVVKGFLINGMTPMVLFFWIGTVSLATINFGYDQPADFALFFGSMLATVLTTDILKAYLADKLRKIITSRSMRIMNIILGIVLLFFGCKLMWFAKSISFVA